MRDEGLGVDCVWINMVLLCPPRRSHVEERDGGREVDLNDVKADETVRFCEVEESSKRRRAPIPVYSSVLLHTSPRPNNLLKPCIVASSKTSLSLSPSLSPVVLTLYGVILLWIVG